LKKAYVALFLLAACGLSIAAVSSGYAQGVCTTGSNGVITCTNQYTPVQPSTCTTTVTVGGTVVVQSGSVPLSTITYPGPPIEVYASTVSNGGVVYPSGICFTGFVAPRLSSPPSAAGCWTSSNPPTTWYSVQCVSAPNIPLLGSGPQAAALAGFFASPANWIIIIAALLLGCLFLKGRKK
jgi:hypothetical protein